MRKGFRVDVGIAEKCFMVAWLRPHFLALKSPYSKKLENAELFDAPLEYSESVSSEGICIVEF